MRYKTVFLLIIVILFLIGCAKESGTSTTSSNTELEGKWITTCYLSDNDSTIWKYSISTITVSGSNLENEEKYYRDINCSSQTITLRLVWKELTIGDEITYEDGNNGYQYTVKVDSYNRTMHESEGVGSYNSTNYCGFSDWELNVEKNYTGKTCGTNDPITYPVKNTTMYNQYTLAESNLYFGPYSTSSYPGYTDWAPIWVKQ